jgi:hypothetical protein
MVVITLLAASLVIPFCVGVPAVVQMTRPFAVEQVTTIDSAAAGLEQSLAKKDWGTIQEQADQASSALKHLTAGPALASLTRGREPPTVEELRAQVSSAEEAMQEVQQAIRDKDAGRLTAALKQFHKAYEPVREAAKRSAKR